MTIMQRECIDNVLFQFDTDNVNSWRVVNLQKPDDSYVLNKQIKEKEKEVIKVCRLQCSGRSLNSFTVYISKFGFHTLSHVSFTQAIDQLQAAADWRYILRKRFSGSNDFGPLYSYVGL